MDFLGVGAAKLVPLGAAVGALVVGLYILKLRRRRVAVPFSPLWERVFLEHPTSSLFAKLKRWLSLLIQLLVVAAVVVAMGDPRPAGASRGGRSLVVLLDGSASMKAVDVAPNRAEVARRAVRDLVRQLGPSDRMLVAQMDAEVTALTPMTDDVTALEGALDQYRPRDTRADFRRALQFARDATEGAERPEVVVVGDGAYEENGNVAVEALGGRPLRFVPVGRRGQNVGVSAFAVRRYPLDKSRYEVFVEVTSYSTNTETVSLRLTADGTPLEAARLTLAPGASVRRTLENLTGANQSLEARIARADGGHDDLPADDVAYATLPPRRRARVLVVSENNRYLDAALLLDDYLEVTDATPANADAALRARRYDVAILDGVAPALPSGVGAFYLRPPPEGSPLAATPGFVNAPPGSAIGFEHPVRTHPLLRYASDLEEAHIGRIVRYAPQAGDRVLASALGAPVLVAGTRHNDRFALLAFDVRESDFPLLVSWPVLVLNAVDWFAGEDPAYLSSFETGQTWRIPVAAGVSAAEVETPSHVRVRVPVIDGRAVFFGTEAGLHRVHVGSSHSLVAGNLRDASESRCAPRATLTVGTTRAAAPTPGALGLRREVWRMLLLGVLVVVVLEWATWHRRVTV